MKYLLTPHRTLRHLPVLPVIYSVGIFIILLDIAIELYHRISFPCYGIKYIKRKDYIKFDRHKLSYLHFMQKFNCIYCGYVNGVLQYFVKIVAETEKYWCGIQHDKKEGFHIPEHHSEFLNYGDAEQFQEEYSSKKTRML